MKVFLSILLLASLLFLSNCSALIYAIRGPKYKGKFKAESYLPHLEDTYFYYHRINESDTTYNKTNYTKHLYEFIRFDNDGKIKVKSIRCGKALERIPAHAELDTMPVLNEIYYIIKDSTIKYEIYMDSYNGFSLYKSRVYPDSIVDWQVGISKMHIKTYTRVKH